ncbi:hypothetical protein V8B55DRAFT_1537486 [Mucor lusitanicus]
MTTLCAALRDLIINTLAIVVNSIYLPFAFWNVVKASLAGFTFCGNKKKFSPNVVAITGANSGIGEGIAYAYAKDRVAEACREMGSPDVKVVQMDVADTKSVTDFFDEKTIEYGIDLFIANAGIASVPKTPLLDQAEKILQINVMGAIAGINSVYKAMQKRGRVVSSVCGFFNPPVLLSYGTSKTAVMSYCRDLRALGKDDNIIVNTIAPGYIATNMTTSFSRKDKRFFLTPIKKGLENDVPLISLPLHQFFAFAIMSALPPSAKQCVSDFLHKHVDPILSKKKVEKVLPEKSH